MTLTIEIPEELAEQFAAIPAEEDRGQFARVLMQAGAASLLPDYATESGHAEAEEQRWWNSLSPDEQEVSRAALARSLADADAGRTSPASVVYQRLRAKLAVDESFSPIRDRLIDGGQ